MTGSPPPVSPAPALPSPDRKAPENMVRSYRALQEFLGWIGVALPAVLLVAGVVMPLLGGPHVAARFGCQPEAACGWVLTSISAYYHTPAGDLLVGALCAIAVFLMFYRGYDDRDARLGDWAAAAAAGTALFPTEPKPWAGEARFVFDTYLHFACAGVFFTVLAIFCFKRFPLEATVMEAKCGAELPERRRRRRVYRACGRVIAGSVAGVAVLVAAGKASTSFEVWYDGWGAVFWLEAAAVMAFGFAWLVKSRRLMPVDEATEARLAAAHAARMTAGD